MAQPARDTLILSHQQDAERAATAFWRKGGMRYDLDELKSEALLVLVEAAGLFDPTAAGGQFGPFLVQRINWRLIRLIALRTGGVHENNLVRTGKKERVREVGLTLTGPKSGEEIERALPDTAPTPEQALLRQAEESGALSRDLTRWIRKSQLTRAEKKALLAHGNGLKLREIGARMQVSGEWARKLLESALSKVRRVATASEIAYICANEACRTRFYRHRSPSQDTPKYCSMPCANHGRRSTNRAFLVHLYVDLNMPQVEVGQQIGCDHTTVGKLLDLYGINKRKHTRKKRCIEFGCSSPVYNKQVRGMLVGRRCRKHYLEYVSRLQLQRSKRKDPLFGTRKCGRKPVPRDCPKCGTPCDSARLAFAHCIRTERTRKWAEPVRTKFRSLTELRLDAA